MSHILIVDDESNIRTIIRKYAEFEGYEVTEAADGMEAVNLCKTQDFDAMIMDIMMPELDGFSAVREIRKHKDIPALMLSARGEEYDRIHGFEVGADDYVVKPFSPRELMMRMAVILQRNGKRDVPRKRITYTYEGLTIDFTARTVTVDGTMAELSPKTYDLLCYLVKNKGIALSRQQLISNVWGYDFFGDDRTLDTHVKLLRSALGPYRGLIVTLRGVGYRFEG